MNTIEESLRQLRLVRVAAEDPVAAYVVRTRLKRTILACAKYVAKTIGAEVPSMPGVIPVSAEPSKRIAEVVTLCNRLWHRTRHLCQPSEAIDERWQREWLTLSRDLYVLEALLERELADSERSVL
jgi:hypothetical protein